MFKNKQQKTIFFVALACATILVFINVWQSVPFAYKNSTDYKKLAEQDRKDQEAYQKYLDSIKPDPVASKDIFQSLITEADVKKEVEKELDVNQKIVPPTIADADLVIDKTGGKDAVVNYFTRVATLTQDLNDKVVDNSKVFFSSDADEASVQTVASFAGRYLANLKKTPVPADAVEFQKAALIAFQSYNDLVGNAQEYAKTQGQDQKWSEVYKNYALIDQGIGNAKKEFSKLDQKYSLSDLPPIHIARDSKDPNKFTIIKQADAVFGLGDTTIIVGNIPEEIVKAAKQALSQAFAKFITVYLDKLITAIESNYKIANFLYYTDAVIRGQYVNDFLTKYVTNPLDRQIVTRFIPQFNCGKSDEELKEVFKAQAKKYLGYDPAKVSPSDPQFLQKLARAGDFMASPEGWELSYRDIANKALSQAEKAVNQELSSSGIKSPRDLIGKQISASLSAIANSQSAALYGSLNLGVVHVDSIVGKLVSGIIENLFNKFLFKGAVVLKEQSACVAVPQLQPVIPGSHTEYVDPEAPPATSGDADHSTTPPATDPSSGTNSSTPSNINPRN